MTHYVFMYPIVNGRMLDIPLRCGVCFRNLNTEAGRLLHGPVHEDLSLLCKSEAEALDKSADGRGIRTWATYSPIELVAWVAENPLPRRRVRRRWIELGFD